MKDETKGLLLGLMGVIAFSLTLPTTRYAAAYLDPVFIGLGRAFLAALVAMAILLVTKQPLPNKRQLKILMLITVGTVYSFPILVSWAMQTVPASHGGVVIALIPVLTAIVATFIAGERPSAKFWLLSVTGALLVVVYSLLKGGMQFQMGHLLLVLASLFAALGYAVGAQLSKELGGWQVSCWSLVVAFPFVIIPVFLTKPDSFAAVPTMAWLNFLYLALVSQLFGFFLWYRGLALGGISRVSQTQLLQPFFTIFASVLLLGEVFDGETIFFALAVVIVVALSRRVPIRNTASG